MKKNNFFAILGVLLICVLLFRERLVKSFPMLAFLNKLPNLSPSGSTGTPNYSQPTAENQPNTTGSGNNPIVINTPTVISNPLITNQPKKQNSQIIYNGVVLNIDKLLKKGSKGKEVALMQFVLNKFCQYGPLSYYKLKVDGDFGQKTEDLFHMMTGYKKTTLRNGHAYLISKTPNYPTTLGISGLSNLTQPEFWKKIYNHMNTHDLFEDIYGYIKNS
jgi:hypothetical protein